MAKGPTIFDTQERTMSNGMSKKLFDASYNLKVYAGFALVVSLFFLGWSVLSFFFVQPLMSFFGTISFFGSSFTSVFLLSDRSMIPSMCSLVNVFFSSLLNAAFFAVATLYGRNVGYSLGSIVFAGAFLVFWIISMFLGVGLLARVQYIVKYELRSQRSLQEEDYYADATGLVRVETGSVGMDGKDSFAMGEENTENFSQLEPA